MNNWGHAGGFLAGLILGAVLPMAARNNEGRAAMLVAVLLCLLTLGSVIGSLFINL